MVALYPKAELNKYPKKFKKYKIVKNKVAELIKVVKLCFIMEAQHTAMQQFIKNQSFT